ncbi:putative Secreted frizzled-related protein 5 [Hypsibius exemplaris]|uniref:Secreted frizzled-related protein 5 n=1 Tax=Hypsibius exemplaris TaxID=2072580 RepID=A0A1W0WUM7_HYPEX|nr:putative Secreted frizzled-related protein 5 [Hypsibius exemplaris]
MIRRTFPCAIICLVLCHFSTNISAKKHRQTPAKRDFFAEISQSEYFQADEAFNSALLPGMSQHHPAVGSPQKCVDIPQNMSLCQGIGYTQMLIPNLMDHETVREANEQSQTWMPLANIKCHQHTRLFLCSLFAPICPMQQPPQQPQASSQSNSAVLDMAEMADQALMMVGPGPLILPCRSLCESVKRGCEGVMVKHGFAWPQQLSCARFPLDNDMCISPNPSGNSNTEDTASGALGRGDFTSPPAVVATTTTMRTTTTVRTAAVRTRRPSGGVVHRPVVTTAAPTRHTRPATSTTTASTTSITAVPERPRTLETDSTSCPMCSFIVPPHQLESAYCQAEFVAKVRFRRFTRRGVFLVKRPKLLKLTPKSLTAVNHTSLEEQLKLAKSIEFLFEPERVSNTCRHLCAEKVELRSQLYLVMGNFIPGNHARQQSRPSITLHRLGLPQPMQIGMQLILPWFSGQNSRDFRQAEKRLLNLKCTTSSSSSSSRVVVPNGSSQAGTFSAPPKKPQRGKKANGF